jgi:hypothetical protein
MKRCIARFLLAAALAAQARADAPAPDVPDAAVVDRAVKKGLLYLERMQGKDGSFSGANGATCGVVGLCGMAFLAKGHAPGYGEHRESIDRCLEYILKQQTKEGYMGGNGGRVAV